jgi:uncharacterized protein (DUF3084 family)
MCQLKAAQPARCLISLRRGLRRKSLNRAETGDARPSAILSPSDASAIVHVQELLFVTAASRFRADRTGIP